MSTPSPSSSNAVPRPSAPEEPGSEALFDELDALLQRMLALPVEANESHPEPARLPEEEIIEELPLITVAEAAPFAYLESPPVATPPPRHEEPRARPVRPPVMPPRPTPPAPPARAPEIPAAPRAPALALPPEKRIPAPMSVSAAPEPRNPVRVDTAPVVPVETPAVHASGPIAWLNDGYDRLTIPLGYTGRWLRLGFGRTLVGWLGIAMLITASALLLWGCIDWTW